MEITTCLCFKSLNSVTCIIEHFDQITKRNLKINLMFVKKKTSPIGGEQGIPPFILARV